MTVSLEGERDAFKDALDGLTHGVEHHLTAALITLEHVQSCTTTVIGENAYADDLAEIVEAIQAFLKKRPGFVDDLRDHLNDLDDDDEESEGDEDEH